MEVHVARMVVVMVLAFLLTWLPYAAMALSVMVDSSLHVHPLVATVPVVLAKSSTVYNPIIYIFMNRQVSMESLTSLPPHQDAVFMTPLVNECLPCSGTCCCSKRKNISLIF